MSMSLQVLRGPKPGPTLLLCAAIHGDELNGVEIVRRVVERIDLGELRGSLVAVPIVNVFGFLSQSRYLPDRRDLNRSFPGSRAGSLAARLAHLFMHEVVRHCDYGIDLHTASLDRTNLPQVRANLMNPQVKRAAEAFGAPVFINSQIRDGSLREAASRRGIHMLVYEAGEAQRFNRDAITMGYNGVLRVMTMLKMLKGVKTAKKNTEPREVHSSAWVRARQSGIFHLEVALGQEVKKRQAIGFVCDVLGESKTIMRAPEDGIVIGHQNNPLVHRGDAIVHLAFFDGAQHETTTDNGELTPIEQQ
jgi:predicted deacylase